MGRLYRRSYRDAGVDLEAADQFVDRIGRLVRRTYGPRVLGGHGAFAGALRLDYDEKLFARNYRDPVLVACTDGVGSKLLVAIQMKRFETIGIDLVAMNVNDMLCCGAEPLMFLDYLAVHSIDQDVLTSVVAGIAHGCEQAGCALIGGETAEMPDLYRRGHFDLAGFAVGVVERSRMLAPARVRPGDDIVGLASSGLHSNGYSLARRLLLEDVRLKLDARVRPLDAPLGDVLLRPTRIYVRPVLDVLRRYRARPPISGIAHITGSGLPGNLPRMAPPDCDIVINRGAWPVPPIFSLLAHHGVSEEEMFRVFNMGIGLALSVRPKSTAAVERALNRAGETAMVIGRVRRGRGQVELR